MHSSINLFGRVVRDIELKQATSGTSIAKMTLVTNRKRKGEDQACFIDVTLFGKTAEIASQYLHKGSLCMVEGELTQDNWTAQDGTKRSKHVVLGNRLTLTPRSIQKQEEQAQEQAQEPANIGNDEPAEDLPF